MPADSIKNDSNSSEQAMNTSSTSASSSARLRTESESSDHTSHMRFSMPSTDGGPPKILSLDEITHVFEGIQNMELAHEIALNPEFKLQPHEAPEDSLEQRIKKVMHAVFWDLLREELNQVPPKFDQAIKLLTEIKECFPQILSQNNGRALHHINEVLDITVIRQQAEQGVLDFKSYAGFIINIMTKSCAPVRDEAVAKLREIDDVVDTFKGILETMSLMKLDMVNYLLDKARQDILQNSVQYEREKFKQFLQCYKGFPMTTKWLKDNLAEGDIKESAVIHQTIIDAYWALMNWEDNDANYPEVLYMDKERIIKLSRRAQRLCLCASLISICSGVPIISQRTENRKALAKQFVILLESVKLESEVPAALESIWEQVKVMLNEFFTKENQVVMDAAAEQAIKSQILKLSNKNSPVRELMFKRLHNFYNASMHTRVGQLAAPAGYTDFEEQLTFYAASMKRIIAYNHSVFGDFFLTILEEKEDETEENVENTTPVPKEETAVQQN